MIINDGEINGSICYPKHYTSPEPDIFNGVKRLTGAEYSLLFFQSSGDTYPAMTPPLVVVHKQHFYFNN